MLHCALLAALIWVLQVQASLSATNNWAVIVNTSAFWFNYRHISNTLGVYQTIRRLGIPDERIVLMLAENIACDPRNVFPGRIHNTDTSNSDAVNLYTDDIQVDYRGDEVSVDNFVRLLTNRLPSNTPKSQLLETDENSRVLVFMTGHGGDGFLKFRNVEELSAYDLAEAFAQMWAQKRYKEVLFIVDTCQAASMYTHFHSPNIFAMASSIVGESSYSYTMDENIGVSIVDRYAFQLFEFLTSVGNEHSTLQELLDHFDPHFLGSTPHHRADLFSRPANDTYIYDFFSAAKTPNLHVNPSKSSQSLDLDQLLRKRASLPQLENTAPFQPREFKIVWDGPSAAKWPILPVLLSVSAVLCSHLLLRRTGKGSHKQ